MGIFTAIKAIGKGISFIARHKTEAILVKDAVQKGFEYAKEYKGGKVEYLITFSGLKKEDYPKFSAELDKLRIKFVCGKPQSGEIEGEIAKVFGSLKKAQEFKGKLPNMLADYDVKKLKQAEDSK